ncbi:CvpA family protein, partial [Clostridium sp. AF29-8BH]|uniref:CvpA family protein n=1 Tax=Clostridium sp. AF29-8BH TaxID=2293009 RepID=UPI0011C241AE
AALAVSAVSLVLSLGVVHFGAPSVANLLRSNEVVYQAVEDSVTKFIQKDDEAENEAVDAAPPSVQRSIIEEMELPEQLKDALLENNNSEVYEALGVSSFTHYVSRYLANSLINIISFFLLFAAVFGGLRVLSVSLNVVSRLPIISGLNRLAGAVLGGAEGIFFVWIAALLITLFSATAIGELFLNQIESNIWLTWLYDHNMLGSILMGVVKRII